ncbi:MAG: hypothetical protein SGJ13_13255 [Actinomycetota bacterium]|nr:hypothetical protein [Actinomycetota bacterium]
MRTSRQRAGDIKLIISATVAVLLAGGLIAIGLLVATNDSGAECGSIAAGEADDVLDRLEAGPFYLSGGGECSFWLALDDGDVVAYRVRQPQGCTLDQRLREFVCNGEPVDTAELSQYPVRIVTRAEVDVFVVDLDPLPATTTPV